MAELMGDNTLQFTTAEFFQCTAGNGNSRICRRKTSRKSIDAGFLIQHIDLRHRYTGCQCNLFNHVIQTSTQRVARIGFNQRTTEITGNFTATPTQGHGLEKTGHQDHGGGQQRSTRQRWQVAFQCLQTE